MDFDARFITEQVHTALLADSANNPHPLTNPGMGSPVAVRSMFSSISYNKGACVIRMTEHLLGFEVHRRGLQSYLRSRFVNIRINLNIKHNIVKNNSFEFGIHHFVTMNYLDATTTTTTREI